MFKSKIGAQV